MTSNEAYEIAKKLREMIPKVEEAKSGFQIAKYAVNQNQLGAIPDAISDSIDKLIGKLEAAITNLEIAASKAKLYADQLKEEERRKAEQAAIERRRQEKGEKAAQKLKKDISNANRAQKNTTYTEY